MQGFLTIEELNAPETTPQALIDTRKYIAAWLYYGVVQLVFNDVLDTMEKAKYKGSTVKCMKVAYKLTVERLKRLNAPMRALKAYINDLKQATLGAIQDELRQ